MCLWWVWLTQQNLPSWQQFQYFWKPLRLNWVRTVRQQKCLTRLLFKLYFSVHPTLSDGTREGLWRLFAGTVSDLFVFHLLRFTLIMLLFSRLFLGFCMVGCRRVPLRCADLLVRPAVDLPVHPGSHLPVLSQKTKAQR